MNENLIDIATDISKALPVFKKNRLSNVAARVNGDFDGDKKIYWLLVGDIPLSINGNKELASFGQFVRRNCRVATQILNNTLGSPIEYECLNYYKSMQSHRLVIYNRSDLVNKTIATIDDPVLYKYDNINDFLHTLRINAILIKENERQQNERQAKIDELKKQENTARERGVLTKGLNKLQEEHRILTLQQEEMKNLTRFIRQQGKLRFNPILDPVQNRIKTSNLFNGKTIVIDGGPGTGKTTTMIQRLKYLTDVDSIEEDFEGQTGMYSLTVAQREHLLNSINTQKDWLFFSPSVLLKEYLSEAMNREGLANTRQKVWNWADFCKKVIRDNYHLFDPTSENAPFKSSRITGTLLFQNSDAINDFKRFFVDQLYQIKNKFPKIADDAVKYKWTNIALNIKKRFDESGNYTLSQFISLFGMLEHTYGEECRDLLKENRENIKRVADELAILIDEDTEIKNKIEQILIPNNVEQFDENVMPDENEEEYDLADEEIEDKEFSSRISKSIRSWFKRYCYNKINSSATLTPRQKKLSELLEPILTESHKLKISRVGELALFEQYAKYTRGIVSNIFGGFAAKYKKFRKIVLTEQRTGWNLEILSTLIKRKEGKELHPQEQSLLLGFINNVVKTMLRSGASNLRHDFITAYLDVERPIIGVDEATDFSKYDIYAMASMLNMDYSSMTLCGDMMQRLTEQGITDWNELYDIVPNMMVVDMRTSYRQSTSLLNVAKQLYTDTIGVEPNYKAHMKSTKVPKPLYYVSENEHDKITWIEQRIKEVYLAYDRKLPSIAIFLNDKDKISSFVRMLSDTDFIDDTGIKVLNGSEGNVLSDSNDIRVYPIDVVKGMEFDVVFFHNIDVQVDNKELMKRYIYVGVSRAAFYLGVTMNEEDTDFSRYFVKGQKWDKI